MSKEIPEFDPDKPIYGVPNIARVLGLSAQAVYYHLDQGHLDGIVSRFGGRWVQHTAPPADSRQRAACDRCASIGGNNLKCESPPRGRAPHFIHWVLKIT